MLSVTGEDRIATLIEYRERIRKERKDYEVMADTARKGLNTIDAQLKSIEEELQGSFKGRNSYSHADVMAARRGINQTLSDRGHTLSEVLEALPTYDAYLVERELKWLTNRPGSPVVWNGKRGVASKYYRRLAA